MKRILFYVHFNKNDDFSDHVLYQLENIRPLFETIVFITNSKINPIDKKKIDKLYDKFIQRENKGFDFAAWRDGFELFGWSKLKGYDSVTIMNDTCFGPVYPIDAMYKTMEAKGQDFWGVTDHAPTKSGMPGTNSPVPYHIQSYLEVFNRKTFTSKVFRNFWTNVENHKDVHLVIQQYETQLTNILTDAGFSKGVFFETQPYSKRNSIIDLQNYSEFKPVILLDAKVPFVKIKSFLHTPQKDIYKKIKKTDYPVNLIGQYLRDIGMEPPVIRGSGIVAVEGVIRKGVVVLRKSDTVRRIARKNPRLTAMAKKASRRVFGAAAPTGPVTGKLERRGEVSFWEGYNPDLAINYAEHINILQSNKAYYHEGESKGIFVRGENDPRVMAIYLPQFHPFSENDKAWGKGFTEWTNVTASVPRFVGQQQPVLPGDLGFYDLRTPGIIKQQIDMAKKYGIYGFQFYYYWFSGKKVMNMPIETVLKNKSWDFNFSICWANENWTRKWDGGDNDIIFEQKNNEDDPLLFIQDVAPILNDERYVHEDGKPMLTVYRVDLLDDPERYVRVWRSYFKEKYDKELWLVGCTNFKNFNPKEVGFDATMDLTPTSSSNVELKPWVDDRKFLTDRYVQGKLLDTGWSGHILDYRFIAEQEVANLESNTNYYQTISPSWSNEARRKGMGGVTFQDSSPEVFTYWLDEVLRHEIKSKKSPLVFINAWNEWAEAAMIEPSAHMGHNSLKRIAETVAKYSSQEENSKTFPAFGFQYSKDARLAVVIHLFYPNMWEIFSEKLKNITVPFDIFVSVPIEYKNINLDKVSQYHKNTNIVNVPNRGRDVLPFLTIVGRLRSLDNYEYVLKLHTKKSLHRKDGDEWMADLISKLLPDNTGRIMDLLAQEETGIVGPSEHIVSLSKHMGSNESRMNTILSKLVDDPRKYMKNKSKYPFIGSTMFWARLELLDPLLDRYFMPSDFESEMGQVDGTTAHAIERILGAILHDIGGKSMYTVGVDGLPEKVQDISRDDSYRFAA